MADIILEDIDPNNFSYKDLKVIAKNNGISLTDFADALMQTKKTTERNAKANDGILGQKYFYVLVGLIAIRKQRKQISKLRIIEANKD